jgi:ABC-2 type transport system ATP-binding protein
MTGIPPRTGPAPAIRTVALTKSYGATEVLTGIDLDIERGSVFALLGPNGAGKTTTIRILATLTAPSGGSAHVAGFDVRAQRREVRRRISLTGQFAAIDELQTGRENLQMMARLRSLPGRAARARASELLEAFDLGVAADRRVATYSGGMRRRLDLAAGLVTRPPVLFLDEPTTGLDPTSRARMWRVIRDLVADGATLLLTTQYLDEADELADRIVVIDHGRAIAEGSAAELKAQTGGARLEVTLSEHDEGAVTALEPFATGTVHVSHDGRRLRAPVQGGSGLATTVVRALDAAGIGVDDVQVHQPSLDDVFFALTGHEAEPETAPTDEREAVPA